MAEKVLYNNCAVYPSIPVVFTMVCGAQTIMLPFKFPADLQQLCACLCATDRGDGKS